MAHKDQVTKPSVSFNISRFESQMENVNVAIHSPNSIPLKRLGGNWTYSNGAHFRKFDIRGMGL
jgi:hypothetical protein